MYVYLLVTLHERERVRERGLHMVFGHSYGLTLFVFIIAVPTCSFSDSQLSHAENLQFLMICVHASKIIFVCAGFFLQGYAQN